MSRILTGLCLLTAACCAQTELTVTLMPGKWEPRPGYLANPTRNIEMPTADGLTTLRVAEPGKGMKFELPLRPVDSGVAQYLLFRYRAANLGPGYAIWAMDGSQSGRQILATTDLALDDQWHTAAVDLTAGGVTGAIRGLLTDVQCKDAPAAITWDFQGLSDVLPDGAAVFPTPRPAPTVPDAVLRPALVGQPIPQPAWLDRDAETFSAAVDDGLVHLQAEGQNRGMKWSLSLPEPIDLTPFRFAAVRYRAQNVQADGDYAIWLGSAPGGMPEHSKALMSLTQVRTDGEWHVAVLPIAAEFKVAEIALQILSTGGHADLWLDSIRFGAARPLLDAGDLVPFTPDWASAKFAPGSAHTVDLAAVANASAKTRLRSIGLQSWFPAGKLTARGIPFEIAGTAKNVLATLPYGDGLARLPINAAASEIYLLLSVKLPSTDAARMGDAVPMQSTADPERIVFQVAYADGSTEEFFPIHLGTGTYEVCNGLDIYALAGLGPQPIRELVLRNRMDSASFTIAAVTLNQGAPLVTVPPVLAIPPPVPARDETPGAGSITPTDDGYRIENSLLRLDLQTAGGIALKAIENRCLGGVTLNVRPGPLFRLGAGDVMVASDKVACGKPEVRQNGAATELAVPVDATGANVPIKGTLVISVGGGPDIAMRLDLVQAGTAAITPAVEFPVIEGMLLGSVADTWYLYARKGGIVSNQPIDQRRAYGGEHPLQVTDLFNPVAGGGLALFTRDLDDVPRYWVIRKTDAGVDWRLEYWRSEHPPGQRIETVPTFLRAHTGDWRRALSLYRTWALSWYKPQAPRKDWFQGVFYYQQTCAWSQLCNPQTGQWRAGEVAKRYQDYFGRIDYLHIFDFGESRVYGRVGDYTHYDELGGLQAMRAAIKQVQDMGIPVGLYIEGYLCDSRGVWGKDNVLRYDIRQKDGKSLMWYGSDTEHMMCCASETWRTHLADCYRRVSRELSPNGMYIDQYGFINDWKTCWSREHGHPAPAYPLRGERDTLKAIRTALPDTVANLTEETPNDVNSQYQDGALGYSVMESDTTRMPHRADLFRFMFPDFKVIQLVHINAVFIEGGWQLLKYPFFNGEGYWLGGGTDNTYCDDAHQFLRRAFAILNENEDAFCSADVEPLVPTLNPTVYANRFTGRQHTVWTLFNAEYRTFKGPCLRVPHTEETRYIDAFTEKPVPVELKDGLATISCELAPRGVGAVIATRP